MVNQIKGSGALNIVKFLKKGNGEKVNDTIYNMQPQTKPMIIQKTVGLIHMEIIQ